MAEFSTQELARRVLNARAGRGIRSAAKEVGISPATLSRVEHGHVPDLETFHKICVWLNVDPGTFLGFKKRDALAPEIRMHFRKDTQPKPSTAKALAELIQLAHREMIEDERV
jgi:transcriptional regulator with XRE-family HTH domain